MPPRRPRPPGRLVWLHLGQGLTDQSVQSLVDRLRNDHGLQVLVTGDTTEPLSDTMPPDHPATVAAFLAHWAPDVIVLTGGDIRPALIAAARDIPIFLIDATAPQLPRQIDRWIPGVLKRAVRSLRAVVTIDGVTARMYRKLGADQVSRLGRMEGGGHALPYFEAERSELATLFATRPVWLAVQIAESEEAAVIAAHSAAMRLAHRLLLILIPQDAARAPILAAKLEQAEGWLVARRELNQDPEPEVSVYIVDTPDELGLWYRLAPVCFMGGSLFGTGSNRSPMEAAALGSAIIHGRRTGVYGVEYGRLGAVLGAAPASTAGECAELLSELLAPDRTAKLAHAAWAVASEGAEVTDRITAMIMDGLT